MKGITEKICLIILVCASIIMFCACGSETEKSYELDETKLVNDILLNVDFGSQLYQVNEENISKYISFENLEKGYMYMGNGTNADSFGVFRFDSAESARSGETAVQTYVNDLSESFADYIPEEAEKASEAYIERKGKYVVFCIMPLNDDAKDACETMILESFVEGDAADEVSSEQGEDQSENGNGEDGNQDSENGESGEDTTEEPAEPEEPEYPVIETKAKLKSYGAVVRIGKAAYELYSYVPEAAENYASAINRAADELDGIADVYDIIIPLSSGITLPDKYFDEIQSSNQKNAMEALFEKMSDKVKKVNIYNTMMTHRNEYLYYRTDHHWTSLGAYYAYEDFCEAKGVLPISLDRKESVEYEGFLGSFYNDTKKDEKLGDNPDTVTEYFPLSGVNEMTYIDTNGNELAGKILADASKYPYYIMYSAFIAGDNPYTYIENPDLKEEDSVAIVIKESFGNCFVPFLVDHYSKVYVIDYRYWEGSIKELAEKVNADDVIFVNNLSMTRNNYLIGKIDSII